MTGVYRAEGFPQAMRKASLVFSWKDVETVSRIEKQFSEHKECFWPIKVLKEVWVLIGCLNVHEHVYKNLFSAKDAIS